VDGFCVGTLVGERVDGFPVGVLVGERVDGFPVGALVGERVVGFPVGTLVGERLTGFPTCRRVVGLNVGDFVAFITTFVFSDRTVATTLFSTSI